MVCRVAWLMFASCVSGAASAQQVADLDYAPSIPEPVWPTDAGPRVVVDAAHHNYHTADNRYAPFAQLLRRDGFRVSGNSHAFTADVLADIDVLVIANALHERNLRDWSLPTLSAFTEEEIAAVKTWVSHGGSLLLIADHMPFPGAADQLASAFGLRFSNGYARAGHWTSGKPQTFESGRGLEPGVAVRGRMPSEEVTRVATFGGSAFCLPAEGIPILAFGPGSVCFETTRAPGITDDAREVDVSGWCQGGLLPFGEGRVAVFGEAAMFTAQLAGPDRRPMGMNRAEADQNHRLLLNVMHWLSRVDGLRESPDSRNRSNSTLDDSI